MSALGSRLRGTTTTVCRHVSFVEAEIAKVMPTRGLGDVELELQMHRVLRAHASVDRAVAT